jgi:hypothetical protein
MARKREYRFKIDAYDPETMPLSRLTEYLKDLTDILGEEKTNVHLIRIDEGSTVPVLSIDSEAEPKVLHRLHEVDQNNAPHHVMEAAVRMNRRLRMDGATGTIIGPEGNNVIIFPGAERADIEYGPFNQPGTLDGVPIMIGGMLAQVPVHLQGRRGEKYICEASRDKAKEIAHYLFNTVVRVEGIGRWIRHAEGDWELVSFRIGDFTPLAKLSALSLKESIDELRQIPAKWKELDDPVGELMRIRDDVEM